MAGIRAAAAAVLAAIVLAGCVSATAVPLSREVWRLQVTTDATASEAFLQQRVLREAADLAFRNAAPYFLLRAAAPEEPRAEAARALLYGNQSLYLVAPGASGGPTITGTTIVVLLQEDDPRAANAYRTLDYL
jgi:hypothetical protein